MSYKTDDESRALHNHHKPNQARNGGNTQRTTNDRGAHSDEKNKSDNQLVVTTTNNDRAVTLCTTRNISTQRIGGGEKNRIDPDRKDASATADQTLSH